MTQLSGGGACCVNEAYGLGWAAGLGWGAAPLPGWAGCAQQLSRPAEPPVSLCGSKQQRMHLSVVVSAGVLARPAPRAGAAPPRCSPFLAPLL